MDNLNVHFHTNFEVSIEDLKEHDLEISEERWDFIMNPLFINSEYIYFIGSRINFKDDSFLETISTLSENILYMKDDFMNVVFLLKKSEVIFKRVMLSKLWFYYEYPAILFLNEQISNSFLSAYKTGLFISEYNQYLNDYLVLYRSNQQNVLWINSDNNISINAD